MPDRRGAKFGHVVSVDTRQKIASAHIMHGHRIAPRGSPEFATWSSWVKLRRRCYCPDDADYKRYGARGISICPEWSEYLNFLNDMGLRPLGTSLDRIDNNGDYEKSNCRWATKQEQARNRRSSRLLVIDGVEKTLAEWSEISGVPSSTIRMRINYRGGKVDKSILAPVAKGG